MEHEVEPLIERAAGDVEMGIEMAGEAIGVEGAGEAVTFDAMATVEGAGAMIGEAAEIAAAPEIGLPLAMISAGTWLAHKLAGKKRKRSPSGVISRRAPTRPPVPERPGKMPKKSKAGKPKRAVKVKTTKRKQGKMTKAKTSAKKQPKKKKAAYQVTIKQEVHGKMRRKNVSYFGFQATAGTHELHRIFADAVLRAVLKKFQVSVRRTDEAARVIASVPSMSRLTFFYRRTKYDSGEQGNTSGGTQIDFASGNYETKVGAFANEIEAKVRDGYYPWSVLVYNSSNTLIQQLYHIGDAKINLSVKRNIKLRNITKNDDNGIALTSLDTNPLQGRLYKFRHDTPRVNATVYETDASVLSKFHDRFATAGVIFGPQRAAADDHDGVPVTPTIMTEDRMLSSPPPGGRIFDNLSSSKKIGLAPGQAAAHKMAFKYSGTVRQFLDKFAASAYTPPSIGYCHMFGFEQKFKTDANDEINVEYDTDDVLKGGCTLKREDLSPPTVITHHSHNSAYT
tara:strand:- start:404 stop:1930 length:1527 start_codon:yes stop_codon:yes gene_type:complete